jgi:CheY-like chemotaxis protein
MVAGRKTYQELEQALTEARARIAELEKRLEAVSVPTDTVVGRGSTCLRGSQPPCPLPASSLVSGSAAGALPGQKSIRVLLADDHAVVRDGLTRLLANEPGIEVVGQAADGIEVVQMALQLTPDIILMDVSMPYLSGVDVTRRLTQQLPGIRVIGLSMHRQEDIASAMTSAGAVAYLTKSMEPEALVAAIRDYATRPAAVSHS